MTVMVVIINYNDDDDKDNINNNNSNDDDDDNNNDNNNETGSRSPCMRPRSDPPKMKNSTQTTRRISTLASRPS